MAEAALGALSGYGLVALALMLLAGGLGAPIPGAMLLPAAGASVHAGLLDGRVVVGVALLAFIGLAYLLAGPVSLPMVALGVALVLLGVDFLYTGITGYCPLYNMLGFSTALSRER